MERCTPCRFLPRAAALWRWNRETWTSPSGYFEEFEGSIQVPGALRGTLCGHGACQSSQPSTGPISFEQFLTTPQLVYQPSGGGHGEQEHVVDKAFWSAGVERRVAVRLAHTMGISSMVSSTDLLVVVPHRLARACDGLINVTIFELPIDIPKFRIAQYWHDRFHADPANKWLRGMFARLYMPAGYARHGDT